MSASVNRLSACLVLCSFLLSACQSKPVTGLAGLQEALALDCEAIEALQGSSIEWSRLAYHEQRSLHPENNPIDQLLIEPQPQAPSHLRNGEPVHWVGQRARAENHVLNASLLDHLKACRLLEEGRLEDSRSLEQSARLLAQGSRQLMKLAGANLSEGSLASVIELASKHHLREMRAERTLRAQACLRPLLLDWIELELSLIAANRAIIQAAYAQRSSNLVEAWLAAAADKKPRPAAALLDINDDYEQAMQLMAATQQCLQALRRAPLLKDPTARAQPADGAESLAEIQRCQLHLAHCLSQWPKRPRT